MGKSTVEHKRSTYVYSYRIVKCNMLINKNFNYRVHAFNDIVVVKLLKYHLNFSIRVPIFLDCSSLPIFPKLLSKNMPLNTPSASNLITYQHTYATGLDKINKTDVVECMITFGW